MSTCPPPHQNSYLILCPDWWLEGLMVLYYPRFTVTIETMLVTSGCHHPDPITCHHPLSPVHSHLWTHRTLTTHSGHMLHARMPDKSKQKNKTKSLMGQNLSCYNPTLIACWPSPHHQPKVLLLEFSDHDREGQNSCLA